MPNKTLTLGIGLLIGVGATLAHSSSRYTVRKGDTLSQIAERLNVSTHALQEANGLGKGNTLRLGMKLSVPKTKSAKSTLSKASRPSAKVSKRAGGDTYTVRAGENDWIVANRAGIKLSVLHRLNPDVRWGSLQPGARLHVPGGTGVAAKTPRIRSRYAVVVGDAVSVRRQQGVGGNLICTVDTGTRVTVLARDGGWYMLRFPKGTVGWVRGDHLKAKSAPVEDRPETIVAKRKTPKSAGKVHVERQSLVAAIRRKTSKPSKASRLSRVERVEKWNRHVENVQRRYAKKAQRGHRYVVAPLQNGGDLITRAETFKGVRYSWGSASRSGTDCSGFTTQVFRGEGVTLPRTSREQSTVGNKISRDKLAKGDLVFFHTGRGSRVTHVGIYMGGGKFIHASSGGGKVQVNNLSDGYYSNRFVTGRRIPKKK